MSMFESEIVSVGFGASLAAFLMHSYQLTPVAAAGAAVGIAALFTGLEFVVDVAVTAALKWERQA